MKTFNDYKKENGSVIFNGEEYALTQDAYPSDNDTWQAHVIDLNGTGYTMTWDNRKDDNGNNFEDGSDACNWDKPSDLI